MSENTKLSWDGEKIKIETVVEPQKVTPKQFMDGLANAEGQLNKIVEDRLKLKEQLKRIDAAEVSINKFLAERKLYSDECNKVMTAKLEKYVKTLSPELIKKAEDETAKIAKNDPNAMASGMLVNQKYALYQRFLATHPKVAENISQKLITSLLFEKPIFSNPFKTE